MKSPIVKRSIVIAGHKTSVSLEDEFWISLRHIAKSSQTTLSQLVADIDGRRNQGNLSSAVRLFVLSHFKSQSSIGDSVPVPRRDLAATAPRLLRF
jgi:predicted DNA-binding ribbon-helix-helix protein